MVNARPPILYLHVTSKHEPGTDPVSCFDQLAGFDPNDPKCEKTNTASAPVVKKTVKKKTNDNLDDLLSAGLSKVKINKKK